MNNLISICMATFNGEKYIKNQLLSILNQTIIPDEVIICDDRSSDNTVIIVENFIKEYNLELSWRLVLNDTNKGYPKNFYSGMSKCNGETVFLADQDDIWEKDKIEMMVTVLNKNPNIQVLSCNYALIDCEGKEIKTLMAPRKSKNNSITQIDTKQILRSYSWLGMTIAFRKDFFEKWNMKLKNSEIPHDFALCLLASTNNSFYFYDYLGAYHRRHDNNTGLSEHRIFKLLNLERKIRDIKLYNKILKDIIDCEFDISYKQIDIIKERLLLSELRYEMLSNRSFFGVIKLYMHKNQQLRISSLISDLWLIIFGDYKKLKKSNIL